MEACHVNPEVVIDHGLARDAKVYWVECSNIREDIHAGRRHSALGSAWRFRRSIQEYHPDLHERLETELSKLCRLAAAVPAVLPVTHITG